MAPTETLNKRPRRRFLSAVAAVLLVCAAVAWHAWASDEYSRSFTSSLALEDRTAAASLARRLEPWNSRFATRATVMTGWLQGKQLLDTGDYNGAVRVLAATYRLDVGDQELLKPFQKTQDTQTEQTNRKAHLHTVTKGRAARCARRTSNSSPQLICA